MVALLRSALVLLILLTMLTGVVYPLAVTGVAQVCFPHQANGSLIPGKDKPAGSELIGQHFEAPGYFWGRLSGTGPVPYTSFNGEKGTGSSGTNLGPLHTALTDNAKARIEKLHAADPENKPGVPVDLATASGSGLDPHISPAAAEYQVTRVAKARGIDAAKVRALVAQYTEGRSFGVLGEPRVNVLLLNLALDALKTAP